MYSFLYIPRPITKKENITNKSTLSNYHKLKRAHKNLHIYTSCLLALDSLRLREERSLSLSLLARLLLLRERDALRDLPPDRPPSWSDSRRLSDSRRPLSLSLPALLLRARDFDLDLDLLRLRLDR
mmetsp:Transcript_4451/g.6595  ORF Transcript_4451/g.6595 Transcript_4451/m.6595 type:complete len:126 (-) Transcript_4451:1462-1839(-)